MLDLKFTKAAQWTQCSQDEGACAAAGKVLGVFQNAYELLNLGALKISTSYIIISFNVWVWYFVWNSPFWSLFNSIQFYYARYYCVPCKISKWFNSTLLDTISCSAKFPNDSRISYMPDIIAFCVKFPNNFVGGWNEYFTMDLPHYSRLLVFAFQSCWLYRRE